MSRSPAVRAAHCAADAAATLLLFDDENHFGDFDVLQRLAEALALTIELELQRIEAGDHGYRTALESLQAAACTFAEEWGS